MANEDLDALLESLDAQEEPKPRKTAQQSLRDRMLNESKASQPAVEEREKEIEEEIISEEVEEENKPAVNPKIIIIAIAAVLIVMGVVIFTAVSNSSKKKEEQAQAEAEALAAQEAALALQNATVVEEEPSTIWGALTYSEDEVNKLRAQGYSNEEITEFQNNAVDFRYPYYMALEGYYSYQLDNELPLYDLSSSEYKELISDTWLSLNKRTDLVEWTEDYMAYSREERQNLDYEKVEPYGNQLFLKIYLDASNHESFFLLNVSPQEWNQLDDSGNVVVEYTYSTHYKPFENILDAVEDEDNIFITDATLDIIASLKNRNSGTSSGNSNGSSGTGD